MAQIKENGAYIELQDNENVFSSVVDVFVFNGKKVVTPNQQVSIALIESEDKYYVAKFNGKWTLQEIENTQPLGLTVRVPLSDEPPRVVCKHFLCSDIKKFVDEDKYVIYPQNVNLPTVVVTEVNKQTIWYVYVPQRGWFEIKDE
ncbi:hypothetical protein [Acidianus bottle-shaped virus 3 strain ABV3]|uniref:Uncharacterized protein n=1 Tax=Acidianus bottle-shaped virus 3 strain ABV3 TaxID=1732174 RepID=A0A0N9NWB6_9VIRU|nr:hypothetical protein AVU00_gp25 [Acidianus bottle-shaped virus 3 strain ABV3]ALG96827.1 hypothetical protein [Acidianus bottle-shaped virus 3 strain ABV3]